MLLMAEKWMLKYDLFLFKFGKVLKTLFSVAATGQKNRRNIVKQKPLSNTLSCWTGSRLTVIGGDTESVNHWIVIKQILLSGEADEYRCSYVTCCTLQQFPVLPTLTFHKMHFARQVAGERHLLSDFINDSDLTFPYTKSCASVTITIKTQADGQSKDTIGHSGSAAAT